MDLDVLKASDGTGNAVLAHITSNRIAGATVIDVDSVDNWPQEFIVSTGDVTSSGYIDASSVTEFTGHLSAGDIIIDAVEPGHTDVGNTIGQIAVIKPTTGWANRMQEAMQDVTDEVDDFIDTSGDWRLLDAAPNTTTALGNRSYSHLFTAHDYSAVLAKGMRIKATRTVTAPIQCADLESSSSQYFRRNAAINGMTWTDDFAGGAWVKLESYTAYSTIISRYNGTSGWSLEISTAGLLILVAYNAGSANYRYVQSAQTIPLNKWVHVTAQLDMGTGTTTPTTNYVMIDGVDVAVTYAGGGTSPTTLIQAGDLQVGAKNTANFFDGKLAQVFVTSAKVTQANVRTLMSQGITPAIITSCSIASAYSLSSSITDLNTSNANDLTAMGSALATATDSPFSLGEQLPAGLTDGTVDFGIVMDVSVSGGNTTAIVQYAEGSCPPTSGGITSIHWSVAKAPYGFPVAKRKWRVLMYCYQLTQQTAPVAGTWYNLGNQYLTVPIGAFTIGYRTTLQLSASSGNQSMKSTLSKVNNTEDNPFLSVYIDQTPLTTASGEVTADDSVENATATIFYLNSAVSVAGAAPTIYNRGDRMGSMIYADNEYA